MSNQQDEPRTLSELASARRAADRPTHVHVVGDFREDPPEGLSTAKDVASMLVADEGSVHEANYGNLDDGDVAFVRIDEAPTQSFQEREELRQLAQMSRVKMLAGIVVFTPTVSNRIEQHLDARVCAESGDVDRVDHLRMNAYEGEVYAVEMEGLHG